MEEFSDYSSEIVEFLPFRESDENVTYKDTSTGTDPPPPLVDKAIETNRKCNAQTQTETPKIIFKEVDAQVLAEWLNKIIPLMESELDKGITPLPERELFDENEDDLDILPYQKISINSNENYQGLATWLSIYIYNTPALAITTSGAHDYWCEHVDQTLKVLIPKRAPERNIVVFVELKSIPIKACLQTLSTNPFDRDIFAGSTVSGDLYIWKYFSNKKEGDVEELLCENLKYGNVIDFDWPSIEHILTCHANGWVCLWSFGKHLLKENEFLLKTMTSGVLDITSISSISMSEFVVGCADGALYHCSNTNITTTYQTEVDVVQIMGHQFAVTSLFKRDIDGRRAIVSCDLSGQVFVQDLFSSEYDGRKCILRIPLPFQSNIACSKDGRLIFCSGVDGSLMIYRIHNGIETSVKGSLRGRGNMIKLSANGLWVVTGIFEGVFQIFSIRDR